MGRSNLVHRAITISADYGPPAPVDFAKRHEVIAAGAAMRLFLPVLSRLLIRVMSRFHSRALLPFAKGLLAGRLEYRGDGLLRRSGEDIRLEVSGFEIAFADNHWHLHIRKAALLGNQADSRLRSVRMPSGAVFRTLLPARAIF